jgi:hypothetical protein
MTEKELRELAEALGLACRIVEEAVARLDGEPSGDIERIDPRIAALQATEQRRQACPLFP